MKKLFSALLLVFAVAVYGQTDSLFVRSIDEQQLKDSTQTQKFDYHFYEGLRFNGDGRYAAAMSEFKACLAIDSLNAPLFFEISKTFQYLGNTELAYRALVKAVSLEPSNIHYLETLTLYLNSAEQYDFVIEVLQKLIKEKPNNETYWIELLEMYEKTKNYEGILKAIDRLEVLIGYNSELGIERVNAYLKLNKMKLVIKELDRLIDTYPANTYYIALKGDFFLLQNKEKQAMDVYNKVLLNDSNDLNVNYSISSYYFNKKQYDEALKAMMRCVTNMQYSSDQKINLVKQFVTDVLTITDQELSKKLALPILYKFTNLYPSEITIQAMLLDYLNRIGDLTTLKEHVHFLTQSYPSNAVYWNYYLEVLAQTKTPYEEGILVCEEGLKYVPDNVSLNMSYLIILSSLKQYDKFFAHVDKFLPMLSNEDKQVKATCYMLMAEIYVDLKQYKKAFESFDITLTYSPKNAMVLNNYAYFLAICNTDLRKAEFMSGMAVEMEPQNATFLDTYAWVFFMKGDYRSAKFYMERALAVEESAILVEHYGDVLFMYGDEYQALQNWKKSLEMGNDADILIQKIKTKKYIPIVINVE